MIIHLYKIEYTPDNVRDYSVTILAESGDDAIKTISDICKSPIIVRTIDTVCSNIQLATMGIVELIAAPLLKQVHEKLQELSDQLDTVNKEPKVEPKQKQVVMRKCPWCDFECSSSLGLVSHKRNKHPVEYQKEKDIKNGVLNED